MRPARLLPTLLALLGPLALATPAAWGHFPWLALDAQRHAIWFFGESPADRTYHLPEAVASAPIAWLNGQQPPQTLACSPVDTETVVGRRSDEPLKPKGMLIATVRYGVYHGTLLNYYAQHLLEGETGDRPVASIPLQVLLTQQDGGLTAQVLWKGQPLAAAEVTLFCEEGHEEASGETDEQGRIRFTDEQVEPGLGGLMVAHVLEDQSGELDGEAYQSESHYLTVTFVAP